MTDTKDEATRQAYEDGRQRQGERATLRTVCAAHWVSHFHILTLVPLLPFLKDYLAVSYVELALAIARIRCGLSGGSACGRMPCSPAAASSGAFRSTT